MFVYVIERIEWFKCTDCDWYEKTSRICHVYHELGRAREFVETDSGYYPQSFVWVNNRSYVGHFDETGKRCGVRYVIREVPIDG